MRVLVTGASGMIGTAVCDALLTRGDEVVGLSREPESARTANPAVTWHPWNATLERPPGEALEGVDGVVNLVGEPINQRWTEDAKRRIRDSRETATRNLVAAIGATERRPRVLVSQSGISYYGDTGDTEVDEEAPPGDSFDARLCVAWEAAANDANSAGVRVVVVRTAPVIGPEGGLLKPLLLPFRLGVGGPIASGRQYMAWVHVDDEVGVHLWALDNDEVEGAVNAVSPEPVTNREFSKTLGAVLHRPTVMPVPKLALSALYGGELAEMLTGGQRAVPRRTRALGYEFRHPALEEALRAALA
jgi:uncharacterized protein (TIGR01777 family)